MNEIDYERMQEDAAIGQAINNTLRAVLDEWGVENVQQLGRAIYKYTECGPWLSVKLHDGTWKHTGDLAGIHNHDVRSLLVGSIVEGSDAEVSGMEIDLLGYIDEGDEQRAIDRLYHEIDQVNDTACALWEEANSEEGDAE